MDFSILWMMKNHRMTAQPVGNWKPTGWEPSQWSIPTPQLTPTPMLHKSLCWRQWNLSWISGLPLTVAPAVREIFGCHEAVAAACGDERNSESLSTKTLKWTHEKAEHLSSQWLLLSVGPYRLVTRPHFLLFNRELWEVFDQFWDKKLPGGTNLMLRIKLHNSPERKIFEFTEAKYLHPSGSWLKLDF